ncbi:putative cytochrome P450 120 [Babylonia areolata]|uniref:putative cytochrome P450 120 n=1 Tax=Babylonia areolata TaxID=304850 RepID=UPI003FD34B6C
MAQLPGSVGWPLVGDKSIDFYKDPVNFLRKNIEDSQSRVFASRFLNKPTAFVCSNAGVRDILADRNGSFELGYKAFLGQIFGNNILFTDGDEAHMFRDALSHLFTSEALQSYQELVHRIAKKHVDNIDPSNPLCLYLFFKQVVTEISLSLFLGLDFANEEQASNIVSLTIRHWHGIISVPLKIKIPGTGSESSFGKAMDAKKELLRVIKAQRAMAGKGFMQRLQDTVSQDEDVFVDNHLLLFTSALVPKALASLLTSLAVEVGRPAMVSVQKELLTNRELKTSVFKEVHRMYPPFLGGRRVAKRDIMVDGYRVPAGYAVVYMTAEAHRDPAVFKDPQTFQYQRWTSDQGLSDENLFGFGYGPRGCIGQQLVWNIIDEVLTQLLSRYHWTLRDQQDLTHKLLPVSRPKGAVMVTLVPASSLSSSSSSSHTRDASSASAAAAAAAAETKADSVAADAISNSSTTPPRCFGTVLGPKKKRL